MPHKHRHHNTASDLSHWELPPNQNAQPLPVSKSGVSSERKGTAKMRKKSQPNDTPRAFERLFQPYRPPRFGQDDGVRPSKKRKVAPPSAGSGPHKMPTAVDRNKADLEIQPHEPLSHFAARVDAALPFATLPKSQPKSDATLQGIGKAKKTKTERKMQKMQQTWREEDQRMKDRRTMEAEDQEGAVDEENVEEMGAEDVDTTVGARQRAKNKKKRPHEDDPWRAITAKKSEAAAIRARDPSKGLVGLHDVVQAPPRFTKKSAGENAGGKVGSGGLKKEVELSEARRSVIEGYRAMMKHRREGIGVS